MVVFTPVIWRSTNTKIEVQASLSTKQYSISKITDAKKGGSVAQVKALNSTPNTEKQKDYLSPSLESKQSSSHK
jgi:hypothetical protein